VDRKEGWKLTTADLSDIVERHGKAIYGFCYNLAGNRTDTEDLYQETFLKAMEICHKIDLEQNPKGYLISIAIRIWKNNRRKYARRQRIAPTEELQEDLCPCSDTGSTNSPEEIAISREQIKLVHIAAASLQDKLKIPLYMRYGADMPIESIAAALHIPQGTVKSRLHNARKSIQKLLEVNAYERY
jgi:RNA polymerase sigma-70 factor (ECF subfamily)